MSSNAELRPYGFVPGKQNRWCGCGCNREFTGGAGAFKTRACAEKQKTEVDLLCVEAGMEEPA